LELQQVRYFLALAHTRNFTRAAEQCNVTQPALTKGIRRLEHELGGELFFRERHLTQLTDLGKELLPMLERTSVSAELVQRRARDFQRKELAPLRIGLAPSISPSLLLEPFTEISKVIPGLRLELREGAADELVQLLLSGEISAAIIGEMQTVPPRIDAWPLFEERYVALLPYDHAFANLPTVAVEDLRRAIILQRFGCDAAEKIHRRFPDIDQKLSHGSEHDLHLQYLATAGFGIVLAPEHMPHLPSLKKLPIAGDPIWRQVRLLAVQGRQHSPALETFLRVARLGDWSASNRPRLGDFDSQTIACVTA
jgi:DNA-binding transcriptional LysR family regulator